MRSSAAGRVELPPRGESFQRLSDKMTLSKPWTHWLNATIERIRQAKTRNRRPIRLTVMGIGQEMFGDDAAGVEVARRLQPLFSDHLQVIEACYVPENFTGAVRRHEPDIVLLVDESIWAGASQFVGDCDVTGFSASSHTGPLSSLAQFISVTMDCEVWIIGIEPADLTMNAPLSASVKLAVDQVAAGITNAAQPIILETAADHRN